jgi:alpha-glucosidase
MQWDASEHAGFTTGTPWLPQAADWPRVNVAAQERDGGSMLSLYRELIRIRTGSEALRRGSYRFVSASDDVFVFERAAGSDRWLVAANFSAEPRTAELPAPGRITASTHAGRGEARIEGTIELLADEAVLVRAD